MENSMTGYKHEINISESKIKVSIEKPFNEWICDLHELRKLAPENGIVKTLSSIINQYSNMRYSDG